jgi:hypothetical protein
MRIVGVEIEGVGIEEVVGIVGVQGVMQVM